MKDFLIIRMSSLGDIIHTLPAFAALRKHFPQAKIRWIAEDRGTDILDCVPGIHQAVQVRAKNWKLISARFWREVFRFRSQIKNRNQTAIDFQGLVKSAFCGYLSRAEKRIGFHRENLKEPLASLFYTDRLDRIPEHMHVIGKNLKLLTLLGVNESAYEFPIVIEESVHDSVRKKLADLGCSEKRKLVVLNIGAAWKTKRWFPERWSSLIRKLQTEKPDLFMALLWGNESEKLAAGHIQKETGIAMLPFLTIKEVMALVRRADLLVSGDTFALQVACAFSRPVVGIFGPTNPKRNGPFRDRDKVAFHKINCSYCYKRTCSHLSCLEKITSDEVAELSLELLEIDG
ncbi:MAG: lipopolysaccharide heptosyltransferase I [Candidatus Aminicenantes bacterium]|nr:lipopolysaccharide heptosyltransferase I [Candidatus Aminicenantes bacterium]